MSNVLAKTRSFIIEEILKGNDDGITDDLDLKEAGVLSSLSTMRLVAYVEDEFDIVVDIAAPRTRFTSITEIKSYIDEKISENLE